MDRDELARELGLHRITNGRMAVDEFSRGKKPLWDMVRIDGVYYDRRALADWIVKRGKYAPGSRRPLSPAQIEDIQDPNPHRIFGKAPLYVSNKAFGGQ